MKSYHNFRLISVNNAQILFYSLENLIWIWKLYFLFIVKRYNLARNRRHMEKNYKLSVPFY